MILIFDLSGVFFNDGLKTAVETISKKYNLDQNTVEFVLNGSFAKEYRTGLISSGEFWKKVKEYLKTSYNNTEDIKKIFFDSYSPHQESIKLIKELKKNNIKVGYLSNSPKDRVEHLDKKFHFISLFDFGLFSYEAHAWKPEKEIYIRLIEQFKLDTKEAAYIDDRERDIQTAQELGMKTILFKDVDQIRAELVKLGLLM